MRRRKVKAIMIIRKAIVCFIYLSTTSNTTTTKMKRKKNRLKKIKTGENVVNCRAE